MTIFGQKKMFGAGSLHWELEVLAAEPPENSHFVTVLSVSYSQDIYVGASWSKQVLLLSQRAFQTSR